MTNAPNWNSHLEFLFGARLPKSYHKLIEAGINKIEDLLWILPLHVQEVPTPMPYKNMQENHLFKGHGKIASLKVRPNYWAKGKGGTVLQNITLHIQDRFSDEVIILKWFNTYPSVKNKLQSLDLLEFCGTVGTYKGQKQIINPEYRELETYPSLTDSKEKELLIKYPTINSVNNANFKKIIDRIPDLLWNNISENLPLEILEKRNFLSLGMAFQILHGKKIQTMELVQKAKARLVYEEFFREQIKIHCRRALIKRPESKKISVSRNKFNNIVDLFPFKFTDDQNTVLEEIRSDMKSGHPMMRLLQGDVGCGKTAVALASSLIAIENRTQVAFMCPTETLALQHYLSTRKLFENTGYRIEILLGNTPQSQKKPILDNLKKGNIQLIIGTHSLIQDTIQFKDLGLAIIDEQHKFGVDQRLKLLDKNKNGHCLIMTATPIPRSLRLTQYGDLDISTIKTLPSCRKSIKTKIITPDNFEMFLTFINTRLSMKEQVYIVVPAIHESENLSMMHLEKVHAKFIQIFPKYRINSLHGQMKSETKEKIFREFQKHNIDILISTSVIEVGIDVRTATVMAIINPERFGLSSLHQLRGRVGRGGKPGFCFLINDKRISENSLHRQKILEKSNDGFRISEEDLKIRGEGDMFGTDQSGLVKLYRLASIITHGTELMEAKQDVEYLMEHKHPSVTELIKQYSNDLQVIRTI